MIEPLLVMPPAKVETPESDNAGWAAVMVPAPALTDAARERREHW